MTTHSPAHATDQSTWPTQLRLPGQAAAPDGPVDLGVMFLMHYAFRRDLDAFATAVRTTPVASRATWRLLATRWEVFSEMLHHHHSGEDAGLWPVLLERSGPEDRATLEAMEEEHSQIDPLLAACAEGFRRLADAADQDARAALVVRVEATRDALGRHLAHEEGAALAIVQRVMTPEDWRYMDENHFKKGMSIGFVRRMVPWAAYRVPTEALDRVLDEAGLPFKVVLWLTRRGFGRLEERTFAHV